MYDDPERELMDDGYDDPGPSSSEFIGDRGARNDAISSEDRTWGLLAHLSVLSGYVVPILGWVGGPLIVYLIKKDDSPFVRRHAAEALNAGISVTIYTFVGALLAIVLVGFVVIGVAWLGAIICSIVGGIAANDGRTYRWPLILRLVN